MSIPPRPKEGTLSLAAARVAAWAVIALGATAMVGWVTGIEVLKHFQHPQKIAMNPATAACFVLAGFSLLLTRRPPTETAAAQPSAVPTRPPDAAGVTPGLRQLGLAFAGVVVLVGVLKLVSFLNVWDVGVDQILFRAQLGNNVMAPNTAFNFVLAGSALLLLDVVLLRRLRPARLLTLLAMSVALLALIGYFYNVSTLYKPTQKYIAMALNTALGFLTLTLGILFARPDREPLRTLLGHTAGGVIARRLLPAALLLPILLGRFHLHAVGDDAADPIVEALMLTTLAAVVALVSLTWGTARSLHKVDLERAHAETALADNYRMMRTLIDNLPDYIFVKDTDNRFRINNIAHVRALGAASQEEVLGKRDEDCFVADLAAGYHDDDGDVIRTGRPLIDKEERVVAAAGGAVRWVLTTKVPLRDADGAISGLVGISHDITERKKAEEERDRFFTLSLDLMCIGGMDGYFKRVNPACESILGYSEQEMTSRPWLEFVHPDDVARTAAEGQKLVAGASTLHFENRYRCKDGTYKWLAWAAVPVVGDGLLYCVARDTTEQKEAEARLREQNGRLETAAQSERHAHEALKRAQSQLVQGEKLASLGQMVAGVAHEINNPLSFVANNVAVLQRDLRGVAEVLGTYAKADVTIAAHQPEIAAELRDLAERVDLTYTLSNIPELLTRSREGLRRIQQIVKDLRDFARLDESDFHDVDLNEGIRSTVNIILGVAKKRQVKIELDLNPLPPASCYPAKVNQVVMNLLANAVQASHEGGTVTVRSRHENGGAKIEVTDQGTGIPEHIRSRIFDPFFTTKPPGEGTGLGLSISYGIVQDHGGEIDVRTEMGAGSTFTVTLPLKRRPKPPSDKSAPSQQPETVPQA